MQAATLDAAGAPFHLVAPPRPEAQAGEVLIRIGACGLNPLDARIHAGSAAHARQPLPAILGIDMAGNDRGGRRRCGRLRARRRCVGHDRRRRRSAGALAENAAVDARLIVKNRALSFREAASMPLAIRDMGFGIHPDSMARLFQPFAQAANLPPSAGEGLGSEFTVHLPLAPGKRRAGRGGTKLS